MWAEKLLEVVLNRDIKSIKDNITCAHGHSTQVEEREREKKLFMDDEIATISHNFIYIRRIFLSAHSTEIFCHLSIVVESEVAQATIRKIP